MSYNYETEKAWLFTDEGQRQFLKIRDRAKNLLKVAGAFRMAELEAVSWGEMACVDRLVELGEIVEWPRESWAQYRVFTTPQVHNF